MGPGVIALLSDLGAKDYFVGAIKGAILSINPNAKIVDITHEIPKQNIRGAAFVLAHAAETFPRSSIFVVVVDPGVGTERRCLLLQSRNGLLFIAPDNGVVTLAAEQFGVDQIRSVENEELMRPKVSATFHGRDLMAPVAAHLSLGLNPEEVGPRVEKMKQLKISKPKLKNNRLRGEVLHVDDFGNLITNIGADLIGKFMKLGEILGLEVGEKKLEAKFVKAFGEVSHHQPLCCIGSAGLLELAKNMGNLAEELGASAGDRVVLMRGIKKPRKRSKAR